MRTLRQDEFDELGFYLADKEDEPDLLLCLDNKAVGYVPRSWPQEALRTATKLIREWAKTSDACAMTAVDLGLRRKGRLHKIIGKPFFEDDERNWIEDNEGVQGVR